MSTLVTPSLVHLKNVIEVLHLRKPHVQLAVAGSAALLVWARKQISRSDQKYEAAFSKRSDNKSKSKSGGPRGSFVNQDFFDRLKHLLSIAIPSPFTSEVAYLIGLSGLLVARTFLSIRISSVNGLIVRAIVARDFGSFVKKLLVLLSVAIPASTINSGLKYFRDRLALAFRTRLMKHFLDLYLYPLMSYKVTNIDDRVSNPEQALTQTIEAWGSSLATLYSDLTKPLFDMILFSLKLKELMGWEGPALCFGYYFVNGVLTRLFSPPFGFLTKRKQELEGEYRALHTRLITYSEEIAFYQGHDREKQILAEEYRRIEGHTHYKLSKDFLRGISDGFMTKYGSVLMGYAVLGLPVFGPNAEEYLKTVSSDTSIITRDYIRNSSLLINLARAIGRIIASYKNLQVLAGHTKLVAELETVLTDLQTGLYSRTMTNPERLRKLHLAPGRGETLHSDSGNIEFRNVPVVTPNGDILVQAMTFTIERSMNLMIVGPNGCGKSSLFRILGGLWPLFGGQLLRPSEADIFYIPQKPYLPVGSFRDQVTYPDDEATMRKKGITDADLDELMKLVKLNGLVERYIGASIEQDDDSSGSMANSASLEQLQRASLEEGDVEGLLAIQQQIQQQQAELEESHELEDASEDVNAAEYRRDYSKMGRARNLPNNPWDVRRDWADVLSGGEKQRVAMARVFYHAPKFAILDECTSAVSVDVEALMYRECKRRGIALITISHRPSLWQHHEYRLEFDGRGKWQFGPMVLPKNYGQDAGVP